MAGKRLDHYDWDARPEDDERLIVLYEAGESLNSIAAKMTQWRHARFSRQMIDGRLKRLEKAGRITRHGKVHPNFVGRKAMPPRPKKMKPVRMTETQNTVAFLDPSRSAVATGGNDQRAIDREIVPLPLPTFNPRFRSEPCCFPVAPKGRGWQMCDAPSVPGRSPYCEEHRKRSWVSWADIKAKQTGQGQQA